MIEDRMYSREEVLQVIRQLFYDVLNKTHPGWIDIVGLPESDGIDPPDTPYRRWLDDQPEEYRGMILSSAHPIEVGESIDKFREWQWDVMRMEEAYQR